MSILASGGERADVGKASPDDAELLQSALKAKSNYLWLKRYCDILIVLLMAAPAPLVMGLAAIAILFNMGRPVFFSQKGGGLGGRVFALLKLRTMTQNPADNLGATLPGDRRITA